MTESLEAYYGLPRKVVFCKRCVMSNQRPASYPEFLHKPDRKAPTLHIDEEGVCDACRYCDQKAHEIDWEAREIQLLRLLDKHRRTDGEYDCLVPGSGGKDSAYAAHLLKYKYGMHPLTCTWPPILYTDYGWKNFQNWIRLGGFDNITFNQNGRVMKLLTRLAIENLLHPFQTFILGQKHMAAKIAARFGLRLIFYGEMNAEYGNPIAESTRSLLDNVFYAIKDFSGIYLGGVSIQEITERYHVPLADLMPFLPMKYEDLAKTDLEVHHLGYYIKWIPQEAYYYATEHTGFQARPFRTQGTYSKYNSIDDKIDDLHYYTTYIKFGLGRASYDSSQEIRNRHLTREEAVALVHRFDGEFPDIYFNEVMDYLEMKPDRFLELCNKFRSPHLWKRENGEWKLRHRVS